MTRYACENDIVGSCEIPQLYPNPEHTVCRLRKLRNEDKKPNFDEAADNYRVYRRTIKETKEKGSCTALVRNGCPYDMRLKA